jgi:hypothetical protein
MSVPAPVIRKPITNISIAPAAAPASASIAAISTGVGLILASTRCDDGQGRAPGGMRRSAPATSPVMLCPGGAEAMLMACTRVGVGAKEARDCLMTISHRLQIAIRFFV